MKTLLSWYHTLPAPWSHLTAPRLIQHEVSTASKQVNTEEQSSVEAIPSDLIPKKRATSVVWKYFGFRNKDVDQITILLRVTCKQVVSGKGGNLFSHLKHRHPLLYEEWLQAKKHNQTKLTQHGIAEPLFSHAPYDKSTNGGRILQTLYLLCGQIHF